jgi:glutamyl/glutaminyl-tRNA synthetase
MPDMSGNKNYRGRIAPSPTGLLHLGHAATFLTAYQRAAEANGLLVFRDEDLDPQRSRAEFAASMIEDLRWFGIDWQEGPDVGGPHAPYRQSKRREPYLAAWRALYRAGAIYPCTCSRRELAGVTQAPHENETDEPLYPGTCRYVTDTVTDRKSPAGVNWRFRVPDGETITFHDGRLGEVRYTAGRDFGDLVVWRRDDVPAYQLACVVDDAAMQITEVVRGEDLLKSTARQILLARALGVSSPAWFHCGLLLDELGQRLAKRHDALSLRALRESGRTPADLRATLAAALH